MATKEAMMEQAEGERTRTLGVLVVQRKDGTYGCKAFPAKMVARAAAENRKGGATVIAELPPLTEAEAKARRSPASQRRSEVDQLYSAARRLIDSPGEYFPAMQRADVAYKAWTEKFPAEAEAEKAQMAVFEAGEKERREKEFAQSFIGRGLD